MRFQFAAAITAITLFGVGCDKPADPSVAKGGAKPVVAEHSHDEGHDHDHATDDHDHPAHGPNGGHVFKLDAAGYQGEWKQYTGNNVIRMYLLNDKEKPEPMPMKIDSFQVIPAAGNDQTPFVLEAEEPDADGKSAVYILDDKNLHLAIPLGVAIEIKSGDTVMKGKIEAHEPMDH